MAKTNRIFISFAIEDSWARDFLKGQAAHGRCPFDFTDMSVKQPWDENWKTNCRSKIRGCDGFIVMLSRNTEKATGARWEISCAIQEGIPVLGVFIHENERYVPPEIGNKPTISWTWPGIALFINRL